MIDRRVWTAGPRWSLVALLAATGVAAWSLWQAIALDPVPDATIVQVTASFSHIATRPSTSSRQMASAVDRDLFRPDRRRPTHRFRLPGEQTESEGQSIAGGGALKLIGTAVFPEGGGFAMCRLGTGSPKLVRIGERLGQYTLHHVAKGKAVFRTSSGTTMEVAVPKAGS